MTAKTVKVANYTAEQTAQMKADYLAGVTVATIAETMGKTVKSVVAKLAKEQVYKKKEYVTKTGAAPVKKDEHADAIGAIVGTLSEGEIDSLTKANKTALAKIVDAFRVAQNQVELANTERDALKLAADTGE